MSKGSHRRRAKPVGSTPTRGAQTGDGAGVRRLRTSGKRQGQAASRMSQGRKSSSAASHFGKPTSRSTFSHQPFRLWKFDSAIGPRVCLDTLRSRESRREEPTGAPGTEPRVVRGAGADPEGEAVLADSVGVALLVVLDMLTPAERLAFVLHDLFDMPFDEIRAILGRSPAAAKQLASRARRRVRGSAAPSDAGRAGQREVVEAFLTAARTGDLDRHGRNSSSRWRVEVIGDPARLRELDIAVLDRVGCRSRVRRKDRGDD